MSCYSPLKAFQIGLTENSKPNYKICSYETDHVEYNGKTWSICKDSRKSGYCIKSVKDFIEIPCGRCIGCRLDYSRQWADRCMLEMKSHESSYFVTITYDDINLPINSFLIEDTGECGNMATLVKRDFQLFMKRLRKAYALKYDNKLRYFAAGEYGNLSLRPHYHAIIFGLKLDDLVFYKNHNGFNLYNSPFLDDCWKKGYIVVAKANWETCAYTARYIMKKQKGESSDIYSTYNFEPEFSLMSRRPGIGRDYFDENYKTMFDCDFISLSTPDGEHQIRPSRYFKRLLEVFDEEKFLDIKTKRKDIMENVSNLKLAKTSNSYLDMLSVEESVKAAAIRSLRRKEV